MQLPGDTRGGGLWVYPHSPGIECRWWTKAAVLPRFRLDAPRTGGPSPPSQHARPPSPLSQHGPCSADTACSAGAL